MDEEGTDRPRWTRKPNPKYLGSILLQSGGTKVSDKAGVIKSGGNGDVALKERCGKE
jgi:hypothetical protein